MSTLAAASQFSVDLTKTTTAIDKTTDLNEQAENLLLESNLKGQLFGHLTPSFPFS